METCSGKDCMNTPMTYRYDGDDHDGQRYISELAFEGNQKLPSLWNVWDPKRLTIYLIFIT